MDKIIFGIMVIALLAVWSRIDRGRAWSVAALVFLVLAGLAHQLAFNVLADDAYISFRYARNLSDGQGLVFNPGEHVEGYSNFLLTVILAGVNRYFGWDIPETARVLGILCTSLTIICVYYLGMVLTSKTACGLVAALLLAASASFMAYGPSGLETPLFGLLIMGVIFFSIRRRWSLVGILISLSVMTRPEGSLLLFPCLVSILGKDGNSRNKFRALSQLLAPIIVILILWTIWRVWYYGYLLPNPIAAKKGMNLLYQVKCGIVYLIQYSTANIPTIVLLGIGLWAAFKRKGVYWLSGTDLFLSITVMLVLIFACIAGGDWMPGWRFVAPVTPVLYLLIVSLYWKYVLRYGHDIEQQAIFGGFIAAAVIVMLGIILIKVDGNLNGWLPAWGVRMLLAVSVVTVILTSLWWNYLTRSNSSNQQRMAFGGFMVAAILLFGTSYLHPNLLPRFKIWKQQVNDLSYIGQWFNKVLPPETWVATFANGALSYYDNLPTIDVLGLTDEHIARFGSKDKTGWPGHIAHDYNYVASRKPVVIFLSGQGFEPISEIYSDKPEFRENYDAVSFRFDCSPNPLAQYVNVWLLRSKKEDLLRKLSSQDEVQLVTR